MFKWGKEIILTTLRSRRHVLMHEGYNVYPEEMYFYIDQKFEEYYKYLENEKITTERAIHVVFQLVTIAEQHYRKVSKELDKEYGAAR